MHSQDIGFMTMHMQGMGQTPLLIPLLYKQKTESVFGRIPYKQGASEDLLWIMCDMAFQVYA